jgi:undecaprenyl-diphosphatase
VLDFCAMGDIAVGFAVAFIVGGFVVRWVLGYISPAWLCVLFGWWRIIVGAVALAALSLGF